MPNIRMIRSVLSEYGVVWTTNRVLYSLKLKSMAMLPQAEKWYEKAAAYPERLDLFDIDVKELGAFIRSLDDAEKNKLISIADKACDGIITGFSHIELDYGNPLDWQLNPLTGRRCDETKKWYKIPDFDRERGDIKVIWEASRFSHFITLARAYLLTDDDRYYKAFSSQLKDWVENNQYSYGANFKCSQECSLRMVNALIAYTVFKECGSATDDDAAYMAELVDRCYRKILSNFFYAYKCIKNNHTISELMGIIVGAWCCNDRNRVKEGYKLLDEVIDEQFTYDGGYRQFSFNYQRLALQDLEVVLSIENKTGESLSDHSKDIIRNSAWLLYQCQDESNDVPNYGSNDGALVFPLTPCNYRDFRPVVNTAYALIEGKQLYENGIHQEELIWFSGGKKLNDCEFKPSDRKSSQFADAGLFTIRGNRSWMMVVSNEYKSRPAHMDQLHIDLWINGINVLCDAGTYSYSSEEGRILSRNESHNTAAVAAGVTQMNTAGHFMTYDWTRRKLGECSDKRFAGRMLSANGYEHLRNINQSGDIYEITDTVNRDYSVYFHTPCDVVIENGRAVLSYKDEKICEIRSSGKMELEQAIRSLFYMNKEITNCLSISGQAGNEIRTTIKLLN